MNTLLSLSTYWNMGAIVPPGFYPHVVELVEDGACACSNLSYNAMMFSKIIASSYMPTTGNEHNILFKVCNYIFCDCLVSTFSTRL